MYKIDSWLKRQNLTDVGLAFTVDAESLNTEAQKWLGESEGFCLIDANDVDILTGLDPNAAIDFCDYHFSEGYADMVHSQLLKDAGHYLVFASHCRWNGASGYTFVGSIAEAIRRSYDAAIYPRKVSKGGKTLICEEYSHDVPTGHRTVIIALTDKEYVKLAHCSFDDMELFVADKERACQ